MIDKLLYKFFGLIDDLFKLIDKIIFKIKLKITEIKNALRK